VASGLVRCRQRNFSEACGVEDQHGNRKVEAPHDSSENGAFPSPTGYGWARSVTLARAPAVGWVGTQVGNDF
jgi:hypothetical protein